MNEQIKKAFKILKDTPISDRGRKLAELKLNGDISGAMFDSLIDNGVVSQRSAYEALNELENSQNVIEKIKETEGKRAIEETLESESLAPFFNEVPYENAVDSNNMYLSKAGSEPKIEPIEPQVKVNTELEDFRKKIELVEEEMKQFGVLGADSIRSYMQDNVDKVIDELRNEISSNNFLPLEIKEQIEKYDSEISKINHQLAEIEENEKTRIESIASLNEEKRRIKDSQDEYHLALQKIYDEAKASTDIEEKNKIEEQVKDLKEQHKSDEVRLQIIDQELNNLEQAYVSEAEVKRYKNSLGDVEQAKQTLLEHTMDYNNHDFAASMLKTLSDQREMCETLVTQGNIDFFNAIAQIKAEEDLSVAQDGLNKVLSKVNAIDSLYDKMGEEILLFEQEKERLQSKSEEDYKVVISLESVQEDEYKASVEKEIAEITEQINLKFSNFNIENVESVILETYPLVSRKNELKEQLNNINEPVVEKEKVLELNSLKEADEKQIKNFEKIINFLNIERKKYNVKELKQNLENVLDVTPIKEVDFKEDFMFDTRGSNDIEKDIDTFLAKHNLTEDDELVLIKHANLLSNGYINMNNQNLINLMKEKNLTEQDLYEYKNLEAHIKAGEYFESFFTQEELEEVEEKDKKYDKFLKKAKKKELSEIDRMRLKNLTLIDENGKERTSFPELREMCYRSELPLDVLVDIAKREQSIKRGGLVKEEKKLSKKLKSIFSPKRIITGILILLSIIGVKKLQLDSEKDQEKAGLDALRAAGENVVEININDINKAEMPENVNDVIPESILASVNSIAAATGSEDTVIYDHSGDSEDIVDETDPTIPGEVDPSNPDIEDPTPSEFNGIEEGEFWTFADGIIAYDGTVTITIDGKTYTAKLPEEEMTYVNGKLVIDGPIFDIISQANSINAAYQNGSGVLKLVDLHENIVKDPSEGANDNITPGDDTNNNTDDGNINDQSKEENAPGTYDPNLPNVEESTDLTEEEKNDAIDSVLDELNGGEPEMSALDYYASSEGNAIDYNNAYLETSSLLKDIQQAKANAEETKAMLQNVDYSEDASTMDDAQNISR